MISGHDSGLSVIKIARAVSRFEHFKDFKSIRNLLLCSTNW